MEYHRIDFPHLLIRFLMLNTLHFHIIADGIEKANFVRSQNKIFDEPEQEPDWEVIYKSKVVH